MSRLSIRLGLVLTLLALPVLAAAQPAPDAGAPPAVPAASNIAPEAKALLAKLLDKAETTALDIIGASQSGTLAGTCKVDLKVAIDVPGKVSQPINMGLSAVLSVVDKRNMRIVLAGDLIDAEVYIKDGKPSVLLKGANAFCDEFPAMPEATDPAAQDPMGAQIKIKEAFAQARKGLDEAKDVKIVVDGTASPEGVPAKVLVMGPPGENPRKEEARLTLRESDGMPAALEGSKGGQKFLSIGMLYKGKDFPVEIEGRTIPIEKDIPNMVFKVEIGKDDKNRFTATKATVAFEGDVEGQKIRMNGSLNLDADYGKVPAAADLQYTPGGDVRKVSAKDFGELLQMQIGMKMMPIIMAIKGGGPGGPEPMPPPMQ